MNFADQSSDHQAHIVARAWQAIGLDPGSITDHLMAEWIDGFTPLTIDEIKRGVDACKRNGRTEPINIFVELCRPPASLTDPRATDTPVAAREKRRMADIQRGIEVETKESSYYKLGLHVRWGAL